MKKIFNKFFVIVCLSALLVSACGGQPPRGEVVMDPNNPGNPDPSAVQVSFVSFTYTEEMVPDRNSGTITYAPLGANTGINVVTFQPNRAEEMLMLVPVGATIAVADGPAPAGDIIAAVYFGAKLVAIAVAAGITAYAITEAYAGVADIIVTIETIYVPPSGAHHPEHDVKNNIAMVSAMMTAFYAFASQSPNPGPENDFRCVIMRSLGAVARYIVWQKTSVNPVSLVAKGTVVIWHAAAPVGTDPWIGTYANKSGQTLLKVPTDLTDDSLQITMEEVGCGTLPPPPMLPMGG